MAAALLRAKTTGVSTNLLRLSPLASMYLALDNVLDADVETAETADGIESFGPPQALRFGVRFLR